MKKKEKAQWMLTQSSRTLVIREKEAQTLQDSNHIWKKSPLLR